MAEHSSIEWTDATWNPITGCSVVSPGCTNCYAMKLAGTRLKHIPSRQGLTRDSKAGPVWTGEVRLNSEWLDQPLRWKRPRRIFVCAHGDLFAEGVPDEWIDQVFAVMALAPQHTFQVLTKRAARMRDYVSTDSDTLRDRWYRAVPTGEWYVSVAEAYAGIHPDASDEMRSLYNRAAPIWPLPNVWLGVSIEDQQRADERTPDLLATPAAIRFVSAEPLLGPIQFDDFCDGYKFFDVLRGNWWHDDPDGSNPISRGHEKLDWIIVGGESGAGARPMHPDWVRSIRDQCAAAGTAFFFKQWGCWADFTEVDPKPVCAEDRIFTASGNVVGVGVDFGRKGMVDATWREQGAAWMGRVSKTYAGRLLDGVEHSAMPEMREVPFS